MAIGNIARQALQPGKLIQIVLDQLDGSPSLWVEHLGKTNKEWQNALASGAGDSAIHLGTAEATPAQREINQLKNRQTVARYSVRKVEGFFYDDASGDADPSKPVPSTLEGIEEVVLSLDENLFNIVLTVVLNGENFREKRRSSPQRDPEDVAKK